MQRFFRFPLLALLATLAHAAGPDAVVHVSLTAPGYTSANAPEFARVKYNKAAPLGIVSDDMGLGDYVSTWLFFNGYPVDPDLCYPYPDGESMLGAHLMENDGSAYFSNAEKAGMVRGSRLGVHEPLAYTDGAGGVRRFAATTALWPALLASGNYTMLSAADCRIMRRTGWSFAFHDVDGADTGDAASIAARFAPLSDLFEEAVGVPLKVLAEPNGNHVYLDAARLSPAVCWSLFQNSAAGYPFNSLAIADWTSGTVPSTFDAKPQGGYARTFFQGKEDSLTNVVDAVIAAGAGSEIVLGGTHGLSNGIQDWLRDRVQPSDAIWVASVDEIWEYYWLRANASIENVRFDAATDALSFDVRLPDCGKSLFREVTVNLPGLATASGWAFSGADTADAAVVGGTATLNVGVDSRIVGDIEALLDLHEQTIDNDCILRDAQYLIDRLAPSAVKDALQARADIPWRYSYRVSDSLGNVIAAAALTEPATISYAFPRYRLVGTKLWRVDPLPSVYGGSFTVDDDVPTHTASIAYRHNPNAYVGANDVTLCAEGEDLAGAAAVSNPALSMQGGAQPPEGGRLVVTNLPPGVYRAVLGVWNGNQANRVTWTLSAAGEPVFSAQNNDVRQLREKSTDEFTLPRGGLLAVSAEPTYGASSITDENLLDYVYVRRTGEVDVTGPELGAVEADTSARGAVTLRVPVVSLGPEAESATLVVTLGGATQTREIAAPGTFEFLFEGLDPATAYAWTATAENDLGASETSSGSATTRPLPVALSAPAALVDEERSVATLSVSVALDAPSATLSLLLDGAPAGTFALSASGVFSTNVAVRAGAEHSFLFTAVADGTTATAGGAFAAYLVTDWFHVRWGADGYPEGPGWDASAAARARSGGAWPPPAPTDASSLAEGRLALASTNAPTALVFAPAKPSPAGADLVVEGVATPVAGARPAPEGEPLAGLAFAEEGLLVWADGAWRKASGASWRSGETAWRAELDFAADAPARVRYSVGGAVATVDGEEWLPVARAATGAERVVLLGRGSLGDFRGVLRALVADPVEIPAPVFAEGGGALAFPDAATFSLTLTGTDAGFWYTAFAADAVEGPYVAEADSVRGTGGALVLTLDADAAEHPARFVRVAVSREPCAAGVSLESFLAQ